MKDDVISRQLAINAADRADYRGLTVEDVKKVTDEVVKELKRLPSAQSEQQWIPVTKKAHPDLPVRVQVQMDNGWIITAYYQEGEWLSVPDCGAPLKDEWIEAWRELPEPYEERRNE